MQKCYTEHINAHSVIDMAETSRRFGESVDTTQATVECFILRGTIKAKTDATTNTMTFVQSNERPVAYAAAVGAADRAVSLSPDIVLRASGLLAGDAVAEPRGF